MTDNQAHVVEAVTAFTTTTTVPERAHVVLVMTAYEPSPGLPIYMGSQQATKLYVGSTEATKVYQGSTQVWP